MTEIRFNPGALRISSVTPVTKNPVSEEGVVLMATSSLHGRFGRVVLVIGYNTTTIER